MASDQNPRKVVLIFGNSANGKTHLAKQLCKTYGYDWISLDHIYVTFVKERYPELYLPAIGQVVSGHFQRIFQHCVGGLQAWQEHVASLVAARVEQHPLVVVEGILLLPILDAVQAALVGRAAVTTVEARSKRYFVASSVEEIHAR